jgi:predicted small secreted protein
MQYLLKKYRFLSILTVIVASLTFTACNTNSGSGTGTMQISLTDAPAAYDQVNIEIRQVLVNKDEDAEEPEDNGEENEDGDNDSDEDENGWYSILDDSMIVNLLDYQNGATLELGETELEAGQYNQIRLLLGDNNTVVVDGETYALKTPSAQQSGYKLNVNAVVEEGQVYELVIDFDASQSITKTGNGSYILKPVLRTVNLEEQPSISGTVLPLDAEPYVYAIVGTDTIGTQPNDEGDFRLIGLQNQTYNVWFNPTNDAYADSLVEGIELEAGEQFEFEETIELESSSILN